MKYKNFKVNYLNIAKKALISWWFFVVVYITLCCWSMCVVYYKEINPFGFVSGLLKSKVMIVEFTLRFTRLGEKNNGNCIIQKVINNEMIIYLAMNGY